MTYDDFKKELTNLYNEVRVDHDRVFTGILGSLIAGSTGLQFGLRVAEACEKAGNCSGLEALATVGSMTAAGIIAGPVILNKAYLGAQAARCALRAYINAASGERTRTPLMDREDILIFHRLRGYDMAGNPIGKTD